MATVVKIINQKQKKKGFKGKSPLARENHSDTEAREVRGSDRKPLPTLLMILESHILFLEFH